MVTRGRFLDDDHELSDRARAWISGIKRQFRSEPIDESVEVAIPTPEPFGFKML